MRKIAILCLIALIIPLVSSTSCNCNQNQTLQLATFNTLLIPIATAREVRRAAQIEYFTGRSNDIDVLCLQELWEPVDRQFFINNLSSIYPYHAQGARVNNSCNAPCSDSDVTNILTCGNSVSCLGTTTGFDFIPCIQDQCEVRNNISDTCKQCLFSLDSGLTPESKFENCAGLRKVNDNLDTSCQFVFGGETDNLLLSKYPIVAEDTLYYSISPFTSWSVTWAKINTSSLGLVDVFCTHVVANQPFFDLSQESLNQTAELVSFIANKTENKTNPTIFVMGDFNFGPEAENITAAFPNSYWEIRNSGYSDSQWLYDNVTGGALECTYCSANPLTLPFTQDKIFDHIFVSNDSLVCIKGTEVFGKELIVIVDNSTNTTLSDHYGFRAWYCPSNTTIGNTVIPGGTSTTGASTGTETSTGTQAQNPSSTTGAEPTNNNENGATKFNVANLLVIVFFAGLLLSL